MPRSFSQARDELIPIPAEELARISGGDAGGPPGDAAWEAYKETKRMEYSEHMFDAHCIAGGVLGGPIVATKTYRSRATPRDAARGSEMIKGICEAGEKLLEGVSAKTLAPPF